MGIVIRQSVKSVFLTYLGLGIGIINTLWLFPSILTSEQIGLVRTIINVASISSIFASLGAANIPLKFFPYFNNINNQHNGFLFFILVIGGFGFLIFTIFYFNFKFLFFAAFTNKAPLILNYYYHLLPFTFILLLINIFESYNIIQQKPVVPIFTREVLTRIFISVTLLIFLFAKFDFIWFVNILVGFYGMILLVLILYTFSQKYFFIKPNFGVFKSTHLKNILTFASFIYMGIVSGNVINNVDSLMLSAYSGFKNTGIYTIAFFIATFIEIPKKSLSQVLIPMVSEANKNNDIKKLAELYKKSSIIQFVIGTLIFILIWTNIDNIFKIIPDGAVYSQGKWVVFFIGLGKIFDMATGINQEIVGTSKYYKIDLTFYPFLGLIAIGANMLLIPKYGLIGAAIATAFSILLFNLIRFIFLFFTLKIQPFSFNTVKAIIISTIVFIVSYYLPQIRNHFLIDIIFRSFVLSSIYTSLVLYTNVSEDINLVFQKSIKRFF